MRIAFYAAVGLVIFAIGGCFYTTQIKPGHVTFTVESKQRIADDNSGKWLVFAKHGPTYQVTDNILKGEVGSTDRYRKLQVGHRYSCSTVGARVQLLSEYVNLLTCHEVRE